MHVLAAFLIFIGLYSGFKTIQDVPENQLTIATDAADQVKVRDTVTSIKTLNQEHIVQQAYDYSCGSAALATLLNYHFGEDFEERQVIQGLLRYGDSEKIAQRRAFSLLDMKRFVAVLVDEGGDLFGQSPCQRGLVGGRLDCDLVVPVVRVGLHVVGVAAAEEVVKALVVGQVRALVAEVPLTEHGSAVASGT